MSERNERIRAELVALIDSDTESKRRDGKLPCAAFARKVGLSSVSVHQWVRGKAGISAANLAVIRRVYPDFAKNL